MYSYRSWIAYDAKDFLDFYRDDCVCPVPHKDIIGRLLIELPMTGEFEGYIDIFENLINKGYRVILAHPERYHTFQKDFDKVYELEEIGVYFQSNIESILGSYGKSAIKTMKRLLKEKKVSFLASDIHHAKKDYNKWEKAKKKIRKYMSKKELNILLNENPSKLIK